MTKKLIINADDFGLTRAISDKIIDTFKIGNLSSTSLLVNTPASEYAIKLAKNNPQLGVGLHFNLTEGRALTGVSSITDLHGLFFNKMRINCLKTLRLIDLQDIKNELEMQFEYIINAGLSPSHIDSHQHIHMNPKIFKIYGVTNLKIIQILSLLTFCIGFFILIFFIIFHQI